MRERVVLVPWNSLASAFILISTDIFRLKESMITIPQEVKQTNHMNPIRPVIPSLLCGTSIVTLCIMQINVIIQSSHQLMETQPLPSLWMTKCPWGQDIETHVFHIYFKSCTVWSADYLLCHCEDAAAVHWAARLLIFWADTPANKLVVAHNALMAFISPQTLPGFSLFLYWIIYQSSRLSFCLLHTLRSF